MRSFDEAIASLNKITANPAMKFNSSDKAVIVNAWKQVNAKDMAEKLGNLSKAFKVSEIILKVEKIREKSVEGIETGNWSPLLLEVESWVLSGLAASLAMGVFAFVMIPFAAYLGVSATVVSLIGVIGIASVASLIDDKLVEKINNEVIRPAH
ncbi:colicin-like pore-forming protein [Erwinia amylovora]|uniref:colicin-like pore-forming protein n=2 Tax=Erwinia amylovora TaxID=552 RepID=UPI0014445474